jgi:hypothetical protein
MTLKRYEDENSELKRRLVMKEEKLANTLQRLLMVDIEVERLNLVI